MTDPIEAWNRRMREVAEAGMPRTAMVAAEILANADAEIHTPAPARPTEGIEASASHAFDLQRAAKARQWRDDACLSRAKLSALAGLSASAIADLERGYRIGHRTGQEAIPESVWRRYALICLGLVAEQAGLRSPFA